MDNLEKEKLKARIHHYAVKGLFKNRRILLFGGSRHVRGMWECLSAEGCTVSGIIDRNSRKSGDSYLEIPIEMPEKLLRPYDNAIVVLILSNHFYREMTAMLTAMGYRKNRHFFILNDVVGSRNDESLRSFLRMLARNQKGLSAYRRLTGGTDKHVFVVPINSSGNAYLAGLFFQEFLERHEIKNYVFVVVGEMCKRVAELFDIQNIVVMNAPLVDDMIRCGNFLRGHMKITVLHDGWKSDITRWMKGWKGLNFEEYFRYFAYDFDDAVPHWLPPKRDHSAKVAELFERHGLQPGKTVVLAPYANMLHGNRVELWKNIAEYFQNHGYSVCTNCASAREKPIEGTEAVFFPFSMAVEFLETAGFFVSLRSGLCDIVSAAKCKKIILYEDGAVAFASSVYDYFGLKKMRLCEDAREMEIDPAAPESLLPDIIAALP